MKLSLLHFTLLFVYWMAAVPVEEDHIVSIEMKVIPGLPYDLVLFRVEPGTTVALLLTKTDSRAITCQLLHLAHVRRW